MAADVGIAMGAKGATAASESADAVIMVNDISKVNDSSFFSNFISDSFSVTSQHHNLLYALTTQTSNLVKVRMLLLWLTTFLKLMMLLLSLSTQ